MLINDREVLIVGECYDPYWKKGKTYDETWIPGTPTEITDPWTKNKFIVFPSQHPKCYPKGYFGDCFAARWECFTNEEKSSLIKLWIESAKQTSKRYTGVQLNGVLEQIEKWEVLLKSL